MQVERVSGTAGERPFDGNRAHDHVPPGNFEDVLDDFTGSIAGKEPQDRLLFRVFSAIDSVNQNLNGLEIGMRAEKPQRPSAKPPPDQSPSVGQPRSGL
jgi:hypothetical protein